MVMQHDGHPAKSPTKAIRTIAAAKPGVDDHSLGQNWTFWHTVPVRKGKDYTGGEVLVHKFQTVGDLVAHLSAI